MVSILSVALVVWLCCSCADSSSVEPDEPNYSEPGYISFTVQSSDNTGKTKTRAVEADSLVAGTTKEDALQELRIWVFDAAETSEGALPIAYKCETLTSVTGSYTMCLEVPGGNLKNIDVYVVANSSSGTSLGSYTDANALTVSRGDLHKATISGMFGVNSSGGSGKPQTSGVPSTGLPMTGEKLNIDLDSYKRETVTQAMANPVNIDIKRCVSKVHFFFAYRNVASLSNAKILGAQIDANIIPTSMSLFESGRSSLQNVSYFSRAISYDDEYSTSKMTKLTNPSEYDKQEGETAQEYVNRLQTAGFTERYLTYLLETDRALTGEIYYKFEDDDIQRSVPFAFNAGELTRNHDCIIYCYFQDGRIEVTTTLLYQVVPWESTDDFDIEFN